MRSRNRCDSGLSARSRVPSPCCRSPWVSISSPAGGHCFTRVFLGFRPAAAERDSAIETGGAPRHARQLRAASVSSSIAVAVAGAYPIACAVSTYLPGAGSWQRNMPSGGVADSHPHASAKQDAPAAVTDEPATGAPVRASTTVTLTPGTSHRRAGHGSPAPPPSPLAPQASARTHAATTTLATSDLNAPLRVRDGKGRRNRGAGVEIRSTASPPPQCAVITATSVASTSPIPGPASVQPVTFIPTSTAAVRRSSSSCGSAFVSPLQSSG